MDGRLQLAPRLALVLAVAAMVACSWLSPLESAANQNVDAGLKRALVSFATARALNAVISVVQGTELAVEPAGIGVTFTPGQILDPVNDLIETFSNLMLTASVAFGIEKVLIGIGAHWVISLILTGTALVWAFLHLRSHSSPPWLSRILIVLLMARFAMPVVIIGSDFLFQHFMETDYQSSQAAIDTVSAQLDQLNPPAAAPQEDQSMLDKFRGWAAQQTDFKSRLAHLKQAVEEATERIIKLMVIFLLQTLVLPLLLVWVLWSVARGVFEAPPRAFRLETPGARATR